MAAYLIIASIFKLLIHIHAICTKLLLLNKVFIVTVRGTLDNQLKKFGLLVGPAHFQS